MNCSVFFPTRWIATIALFLIVSAAHGQDTTVEAATQDSIFAAKDVDVLPLFPCYDDIEDIDERKKCADKNMILFIYNRMIYPAEAREAGIEGSVLIEFVIEKDGSITNLAIVKNLDKYCDAAALEPIEQMQADNIIWTPAMLDGEAVRSRFILPLKFRMN